MFGKRKELEFHEIAFLADFYAKVYNINAQDIELIQYNAEEKSIEFVFQPQQEIEFILITSKLEYRLE